MTRPKLDAIPPSFIVSDVERTIAFYRDKLGFETRFLQPEKTRFSASLAETERRSSSKPKETSRPFRTTHVIAT